MIEPLKEFCASHPTWGTCAGTLIKLKSKESCLIVVFFLLSGMICLADELTSSSQKQGGQAVVLIQFYFLHSAILHIQPHGAWQIGGLHCLVDRNHFGRQLQSFEEALQITDSALKPDQPFMGVFIRAPCVTRVNNEKRVKVLAQLDRKPHPLVVAVQQDHLLATAFHPEIFSTSNGNHNTDDVRWHQYFVKMVREWHVKQHNTTKD